MNTKKLIYSKNPFRRIAALFLAVNMVLSLLPVQGLSLFGSQTVKAAAAALSNPRAEGGTTTWDCVYFGNYVQSGEDGADPEPIKWRVLSVDGDDVFLLADKNLEIQKYNNSYSEVTWATCSLRTWLNGEFLSAAFTADEQAAIKTTTVVNNNNPTYGTSGGVTTEDKVYLLSVEEAKNTAYGFTDTDSNTDTRKVEDTAHVKKQNSGNGSYGRWWLRSPGGSNYVAVCVGASGWVPQDGYNVYGDNPAVRPALHINLQSLSQWNYAGTVDSEGNVVEPEPILSNPETEDGVTTWDCVYFGNYVQSGEEGAAAEPVKWRVLSVNGNDAFLLADKNLEIKKYNETYREVTWETSTLRSWLNGYSGSYNANSIDYSGSEASFLDNAFTADEQAAIKTTTVVNNNNPEYGTSGGATTQDKVYLLSIEETKKTEYGFTSTDSDTNTRKVEDTAYVKKQNSGYGSYGLWWLRSPGNSCYRAAYVVASGGVTQTGYSVYSESPAVRPALHINLQSLSLWNYAGTVDSEGNVTEPGSSITVGGQMGNVTYGVGGSVTYEVEGKNFDDPEFDPKVVWEDTEPEGVTPTFNDGNTLLTLNASATANAGNYPFKVTSGETESAAATLIIGKADASAITTAVENVSMTAYEAREHTTKEAVVALADLPSQVEVSLSGGSTATLSIAWATSTIYDAKGGDYDVTGTLTGNDNVNVGSVTGSVTVTVTPINAPKPTFADIYVLMDATKPTTAAGDLGSDVLPDGGTITISIGSSITETVDYTIAWSGTEMLDMTAKDNHMTFTGETSYPEAPEWLTLPDTTVTRKVIVTDKTPVTVTGINVDNKIYDGTAVTKSGTPAAKDRTSDVEIRDYDYEWQDAEGSTLAGAPKDAGIYKLIVSVPDSNPDYTGSQEINFTISKAAVTVTAEDKTAAVDDPEPIYTYTVDGLASGESLKTDPTLSCTPDMNTAGTYTITPSAAEVPDSENYEDDITYVNGTLTVQVTNITVSFHANGGSGSMASVSVQGGSYTLPSCTFGRSNYSFAGWKVANTGAAYAAGAFITVDGDVTLYAQWTYNGDAFTPVTDLTGVPTKATVGTALTLQGTVRPGGATNRTVQWTVKSKGTTGAKISGGKLQTTGSGTAVITATIKNGKTSTADYTKDFTIKVSYPVKKGSTYTVSGYRYKVTSITNSKKEVTFAGLTAAKKRTATTLNIGDTVKIKGVTMKITAVGKNALKGNKKVRTVKIGNNVQTIGYGAFSNCTALKTVTIGTGLVTMEGHLFCQDTKLKTITIKSTRLKRVESNHVFVKVKATVKVPASKVSAYTKLLKGKSGSLKVTK